MRLGATIATLAGGACLALTGTASAATEIGEASAPESGSCVAGNTFLTTGSPAGQHAAPFAGVITSWRYQALGATPQLRLKVLQPFGASSFAVVGQSSLETASPGTLNSFSTRIATPGGAIIGIYLATSGPCGAPAAGWEIQIISGDPAPGTTSTTPGPVPNYHYDVAATLEPDADHDGFGDETQDQCPTDPTLQSACAAPDTTITKGPKDKTRKKQATFEFSSTIAGATFECSLDDAPFASCSSPDTIKVKKGKHHFEVRSTAAGSVDASPASDDWKVKKPKSSTS